MPKRLMDFRKAGQNRPKADTEPNDSNEQIGPKGKRLKGNLTKIPRVTVRYDPKRIQQVKLKDDLMQLYTKFSEERNLGWSVLVLKYSV